MSFFFRFIWVLVLEKGNGIQDRRLEMIGNAATSSEHLYVAPHDNQLMHDDAVHFRIPLSISYR